MRSPFTSAATSAAGLIARTWLFHSGIKTSATLEQFRSQVRGGCDLGAPAVRWEGALSWEVSGTGLEVVFCRSCSP